MAAQPDSTPDTPPVLLYDDECNVCRHIAAWVRKSAQGAGSDVLITVRGIGEDPQALKALNPALDIWAAYDHIHLLMPDGSMRLGGGAVAEVLRLLPATRWLTGCLMWRVFGWYPFQRLLDLAYALLADIRPILGCESCGQPSPALRPFVWLSRQIRARFEPSPKQAAGRHFTPR